jgi:hypothetical protein
VSRHTHSQHDPIREDVEAAGATPSGPIRCAMHQQRVGAAIFGVMFLILAGVFICMAAEEKVRLLYLISVAPGYIERRTLRNAFKLG